MERHELPHAIVYTSNTGHTRQYAEMLGQKLQLPVLALEEAMAQLPEKSCVLYLGWIHANRIKGYSRAVRRFSVCAACAVGLCDTGTLLSEVRRATSVPDTIPLFTLQGGFCSGKIKGLDKILIAMLQKGLSAQQQRSAQEERMLQLLQQDKSYVCEENLTGILAWYREHMAER